MKEFGPGSVGDGQNDPKKKPEGDSQAGIPKGVNGSNKENHGQIGSGVPKRDKDPHEIIKPAGNGLNEGIHGIPGAPSDAVVRRSFPKISRPQDNTPETRHWDREKPEPPQSDMGTVMGVKAIHILPTQKTTSKDSDLPLDVSGELDYELVSEINEIGEKVSSESKPVEVPKNVPKIYPPKSKQFRDEALLVSQGSRALSQASFYRDMLQAGFRIDETMYQAIADLDKKIVTGEDKKSDKATDIEHITNLIDIGDILTDIDPDKAMHRLQEAQRLIDVTEFDPDKDLDLRKKAGLSGSIAEIYIENGKLTDAYETIKNLHMMSALVDDPDVKKDIFSLRLGLLTSIIRQDIRQNPSDETSLYVLQGAAEMALLNDEKDEDLLKYRDDLSKALAEKAFSLGNFEEAEDFFNSIREPAKKINVLGTLCQTYAKIGELERLPGIKSKIETVVSNNFPQDSMVKDEYDDFYFKNVAYGFIQAGSAQEVMDSFAKIKDVTDKRDVLQLFIQHADSETFSEWKNATLEAIEDCAIEHRGELTTLLAFQNSRFGQPKSFLQDIGEKVDAYAKEARIDPTLIESEKATVLLSFANAQIYLPTVKGLPIYDDMVKNGEITQLPESSNAQLFKVQIFSNEIDEAMKTLEKVPVDQLQTDVINLIPNAGFIFDKIHTYVSELDCDKGMKISMLEALAYRQMHYQIDASRNIDTMEDVIRSQGDKEEKADPEIPGDADLIGDSDVMREDLLRLSMLHARNFINNPDESDT